MKTKIGRIEGPLPHKFVITREEEYIVFYAFPGSINGRKILHDDIVRRFNLENILGGGSCYYKDWRSELSIGDYSSVYGGVPTWILDCFKDILFEEYRKLIPNLEKQKMRSDGDQSVHRWLWDKILEEFRNGK